MKWDSSVDTIKGVGPALAGKLSKIGIDTVGDMLTYFPRQYNDYSDVVSIIDMQPGLVTLNVQFENITERRVRRGMHLTAADAVDKTGKVRVVWFNQPYRSSQLNAATNYVLRGMYELKNARLQIINPSVERADEVQADSTIIPTYSERNGLKNHQIKKIMLNAMAVLPTIKETLPPDIIQTHALMPLPLAYKEMHTPSSETMLAAAKRRFAFEELFVVMAAAEQMRQMSKRAQAHPIVFDERIAKQFVAELPFAMTDDQRAASWKILQDMQSDDPMNRLLEGDVGSGKTLVAAMASLMALENGMQVAFIAPTEILAKQHYATLKNILSYTKHSKDIALLVGSLKKSEKQKVKDSIARKQATLLVGTHALLEEDIDWHTLGLVIIDEQHRFGVKQRQKLQTKTNFMPHVLCMTATPIPRSLALTVYGELSISVITQKPINKPPITTELVSPNSVAQMYQKIALSLQQGRQAYIVCPLISQSDITPLPSAEETYKTVSQKYLKGYRIGLLHGRQKAAEKDAVMQQFKNGELDVLVATTVIEVGVDVPNATDMAIVGADRFGLAQLHQLRGRVGRGEHPGRCYLVMSDSHKPSKRMHAIVSTSDGFKLAEYDLELRGAGAIYGTMQHGALDLRYVQLTDYALIAEVRSAVLTYTKKADFMVKYPQLADKITKTLQLTHLN
jgi:ATP-dependent DNA helicase RecG